MFRTAVSELSVGLLTGEKVSLRTLEFGDLEFLYRWENDPVVWPYGDCGAEIAYPIAPTKERFSRNELHKLIESQQHDIHVTEQLRFVICRRDPLPNPSGPLSAAYGHPSAKKGRRQKAEELETPPDIPIGFIDLFDYNSVERNAGVGILICDSANRRKGYGHEALSLTTEYARQVLGLHELWCNVTADNLASHALFAGAGFVGAGNNKKLLTFARS